MQKQLLENVIRKFLFEQGSKLTIDLGKVTERDRSIFTKFIEQQIMKKEQYTANDAGVVRIEITRTGGRTDDGTTKKSSYTDNSVLTDALSYLNRVQSGLLSTYTTKEFVWFLIINPYEVKPNKEEQRRAKYSVLAMYVRTTLLFRIPESGTGYLDTLSRGATIYDLAKITNTEWKPKGKLIIEPATQGGESIETLDVLPFKQIEFGTKYTTDVESMNMLYAYFEKNFTTLGIENVREFKKQAGFGCELKSIIEQFQSEQNIEVNGIWNIQTRRAAVALKDLEYTVRDTNSLKDRYKTCQLENKETFDGSTSSDIKIPESGYFKYAGRTADPKIGTANDPEFYKVQKLMISYFEKLLQQPGVTKKLKTAGIYKFIYKKYETLKILLTNPDNHGDYGDTTKAMVKFLKDGFKMTSSPDQVESDFINKLK